MSAKGKDTNLPDDIATLLVQAVHFCNSHATDSITEYCERIDDNVYKLNLEHLHQQTNKLMEHPDTTDECDLEVFVLTNAGVDPTPPHKKGRNLGGAAGGSDSSEGGFKKISYDDRHMIVSKTLYLAKIMGSAKPNEGDRSVRWASFTIPPNVIFPKFYHDDGVCLFKTFKKPATVYHGIFMPSIKRGITSIPFHVIVASKRNRPFPRHNNLPPVPSSTENSDDSIQSYTSTNEASSSQSALLSRRTSDFSSASTSPASPNSGSYPLSRTLSSSSSIDQSFNNADLTLLPPLALSNVDHEEPFPVNMPLDDTMFDDLFHIQLKKRKR